MNSESRTASTAPAPLFYEDRRPPLNGWAPGRYMCKCFNCEQQFTGDKRAISCAECAYNNCWRLIETAPKNRMLLVGFFNSLGKWRSMHAQWRDDLPQHDDADDEDEHAPAGWYEGSLEAEMLFPCRPTYWRLLPEPPLQRNGDRESDATGQRQPEPIVASKGA